MGKSIILDFGTSSCLKENIGKKTLTLFEGNYENSSIEMKKLYKR